MAIGTWISGDRTEDINVKITGLQMAFELGEIMGMRKMEKRGGHVLAFKTAAQTLMT